jgi:hypothetical protein
MANLKYRGNTTSPTKPTSTTAKNAPLTNEEIDGNLCSLNDSKLEANGWTPGDTLYADATGNLVRLPIGSTGTLLSPVNGYPSWVPASALGDNVNIQEFSSVGTSTWVKPVNATMVNVIIYSGGSSGIGGTAYSSISSTKSYPGGVGGHAGSRTEFWIPASALASTVQVVCGAGGAAQTLANTNNPGSTSSFGTYYAIGGLAIFLATFESGVSAGSGFLGMSSNSVMHTTIYGYSDSGFYFSPLTGRGNGWSSDTVGSNVIVTARAGQVGGLGAGGGGTGGGINSNSTWNPGADGGRGGGALTMSSAILNATAIGGNGPSGYGSAGGTTSGAAGTSSLPAGGFDGYFGGNGGGGGASSVTGNGGNGGDGSWGAGGGGGGACLSGFTPGLGGKGGDGFVRVIAYK